MSLTARQLEAQVDLVLKRHADAEIIGIRAATEQDWPQEIHRSERTYRVVWCDTPLAARQSVSDAGAAGLVIVTPLDENSLGTDFIARLKPRRLMTADPWCILKETFRAHTVDPRLNGKRWLAELLLEFAPAEGYPPVSGGHLDATTAWRHLLDGALGLSSERPDVIDLLTWTVQADGPRRYGQLSNETQTEIADYIADTAGEAGSLIMSCVRAGHAAEAFSIGLALDVIYGSDNNPSKELMAANVRLEQFTQGRSIGSHAARSWIDAARTLAGNPQIMERSALFLWLERTDTLLNRIQASGFASESDFSPKGFEARLAAFGDILQRVMEGVEVFAALSSSRNACAKHILSVEYEERIHRLDMAVRLLRWLHRPIPKDNVTFGELALEFAYHSAFADIGRRALSSGDEQEELARAFGNLRNRGAERREVENRCFASALSLWNKSASSIAGVLPVENVIEKLVAPLATQAPVLLLVVDGLSLPIFRELFATIDRQGWAEIVPQATMRSNIGIAALPTVTAISRTSLLSGMLKSGAAPSEKAAFEGHDALIAASKSKKAPVLFHKGDLSDPTTGDLASSVRNAVAARDQTVVGVVYNAIDDQLSGASQLNIRWQIRDLQHLATLLVQARNAGRILVVTADHGHVLDEQTTMQGNQGDGDRWRRASGVAPKEGEIALQEGRVLAPDGSRKVVLAWSEKLRYSSKKNGYHGGASPQEVLVPLSVFASANISMEGWVQAPPVEPDWWFETELITQKMTAPPPSVSKSKSREQPDLFSPSSPAMSTAWIDALLASDAWAAQLRLVGRAAPQEGAIRAILEKIQARGWKASYSTLAQAAKVPTVRVRGLLSGLRRALNVDGAPVFTLDEGDGFAELNVQLLVSQFQIERP